VIFTHLYSSKNRDPNERKSAESLLRAIAGGKDERFTNIEIEVE